MNKTLGEASDYFWPDEAIWAANLPIGTPAPTSRGVYFLFREDQLAYVGKSEHFSTRLSKHRYPDGRQFKPVTWLTHYAIIPVPYDYLDTVESFFIHLFEPPLNKEYKLCPIAGEYLEEV